MFKYAINITYHSPYIACADHIMLMYSLCAFVKDPLNHDKVISTMAFGVACTVIIYNHYGDVHHMTYARCFVIILLTID